MRNHNKLNKPINTTFIGMLKQKSTDRSLRKAERTKYLILSDLAEHINDAPTSRITVETILNDLGLSRGTFYNYFDDINHSIYVLLEIFLETWNINKVTNRDRGHDLFKAIFTTNLSYCLRYEKNACFFAAFSYYSANMKELLELRDKINTSWSLRVIRSLELRHQIKFNDQESIYIQGALRMLISMTISILEEYYVYKNCQLNLAYKNSHELAYALSMQWYPTLANPKDFTKVAKNINQ